VCGEEDVGPFVSCRFGFCLILLLWETFLTWVIKKGNVFLSFLLENLVKPESVGYPQNYQLEFIDTRKRYLLHCFKLLISLLPCKQKFKRKRRKGVIIKVPSCPFFPFFLFPFSYLFLQYLKPSPE